MNYQRSQIILLQQIRCYQSKSPTAMTWMMYLQLITKEEKVNAIRQIQVVAMTVPHRTALIA